MKVNGKELAVEVQGDAAEAVLMVHGLGGTSNTYMPQAGLLARWFKVVRPDLEGSGRSPAAGALSIESFVTDMFALMDALKLESAHLMGHSMGTIVCQHMAAQAPKRVKSLALLGPLAEPPEPARKAIGERAAKARAEGMVGIADALVQAATSAETKAARAGVVAFVREIVMRQDAEGYARTCEALAQAKSAKLAAIICPTLLVTGDEDGVAPPPVVQKLGKAITGARVRVLSGCGHWTPVEKPAEVNATLLNFYFG